MNKLAAVIVGAIGTIATVFLWNSDKLFAVLLALLTFSSIAELTRSEEKKRPLGILDILSVVIIITVSFFVFKWYFFG